MERLLQHRWLVLIVSGECVVLNAFYSFCFFALQTIEIILVKRNLVK